jgi:hypothetical protein
MGSKQMEQLFLQRWETLFGLPHLGQNFGRIKL